MNRITILLSAALSMQAFSVQAMESGALSPVPEAATSTPEINTMVIKEALEKLGSFNPVEFQKIFIALTQAKNKSSFVDSTSLSTIPVEILENPKALQTLLLAMMILRKKMIEPQTATVTLDEQLT